MVMYVVLLALVAGASGFIGWWIRGRELKALSGQTDPAALASAQQQASQAREKIAGHAATVEQLKGRVTEITSERDQAREEAKAATARAADLRTDLETSKARMTEEKRGLEEQMKQLQEDAAGLTKTFESAANRLFDAKSETFRNMSANQIGNLLKPFSVQLEELKKGVVDASQERHALTSHIERIALEAHSLTNALRGDPKAQGDWGEMVIETILENSGLTKDVNYFIQYSAKNENDKTVFLDVLLKLPDDRYMVVDSKAAITEYDRYMNSETDEDKQAHLNALVASLKTQINGLSEKGYDRLKGLPMLEAVLMWVPNEGALTAAIRQDRSLLDYAHKRRVIPVTATTLFATVKVVERLWQYEKQNKSVQEIIERAARIYDKFVGFTEAMDAVGKALGVATDNYQTAKSRLLDGSGNVVRQLEQLHDLAGLPTKARLKGEWSQKDTLAELPAPEK